MVWHPTDLAKGASTGGPQGTKTPVHTNFWVQRGSPTNRVREPRNKEPEDAEKKKD